LDYSESNGYRDRPPQHDGALLFAASRSDSSGVLLVAGIRAGQSEILTAMARASLWGNQDSGGEDVAPAWLIVAVRGNVLKLNRRRGS
jgi:hypothetical protein